MKLTNSSQGLNQTLIRSNPQPSVDDTFKQQSHARKNGTVGLCLPSARPQTKQISTQIVLAISTVCDIRPDVMGMNLNDTFLDR